VVSYPNASSGFSNYFPIPDYQAKDVAAYFAFIDSLGTIPEDGRFNRSGRGFPDVSAQGENIEIVVGASVLSFFLCAAIYPEELMIFGQMANSAPSRGPPAPAPFLRPLSRS
jgi:tripeptidyl-peptidase-1